MIQVLILDCNENAPFDAETQADIVLRRELKSGIETFAVCKNRHGKRGVSIPFPDLGFVPGWPWPLTPSIRTAHAPDGAGASEASESSEGKADERH